MSLLTNLFVLGSYAIVALALTMGLQAFAEIEPVVGWIAAAVFFVLAAQVHGALNRAQENTAIGGELDALRKALGTSERDLEALHGEVEILTDQVESSDKERNRKLVSEMRVLESLVQQLAVGVAKRSAEERESAQVGVDGECVDDELNQAWQVAAFDSANPSAFDRASEAQLLDAVRQSLDENRVDLYLQPIVSLPQRRIRYYEALTRLRSDDGEILMPRHYLRVAENAGLMSTIDNLLLFRCVQVVRKLIERSRDVAVFCNISAHSLQDNLFFPQFLEFMESNADLSSRLIFEFGQDTLETCGPMELANLRRLAGLGFYFSMDQVASLEIDPVFLRDRNFRYVKAPAHVLISQIGDTKSDFHISDLKEQLARHGLDLIAEKIEDDRAVAEILELNVDYGQGFLFGEPRPLKGGAIDEDNQLDTGQAA